jgi:hypothetical protein
VINKRVWFASGAQHDNAMQGTDAQGQAKFVASLFQIAA